MQSRVYTDRSGLTWQVFQVQRSTKATAAVTPGREFGWLTFVCSMEKRRLAPPPAGWDAATSEQLEELCSRAMPVPRDTSAALAIAQEAIAAATDGRRAPRADEDMLTTELRDVVRSEARTARETGLQVIQALTKLRSTLASHGVAVQSPEFRDARKLFLNVFYFERRD